MSLDLGQATMVIKERLITFLHNNSYIYIYPRHKHRVLHGGGGGYSSTGGPDSEMVSERYRDRQKSSPNEL